MLEREDGVTDRDGLLEPFEPFSIRPCDKDFDPRSQANRTGLGKIPAPG